MAKKKTAPVEKKTLETPHPNKKKIMTHGIGLHLVSYVLLALFMTLIGVPAMISFIVFMVLAWGLFVMSYAYYFHM